MGELAAEGTPEEADEQDQEEEDDVELLAAKAKKAKKTKGKGKVKKSSEEGKESSEKSKESQEESEQDCKGPYGLLYGAEGEKGEDSWRPDGEGPYQEQVRQDREQEELCRARED